jgi:uncharacterized lipoprotein YbaY
VHDGERRPGRAGGRRVRRAVPALAVGFALVSCSQALAAEPHPTTVSVDCGSEVLVAQPATCTATVTDTEATPSTPTGTVSFSSDSEGTFSPTACELSPSTGTEQANSCPVKYDPTKIGSGTHKITAAYDGDSEHAAESSPSAALAVGLRGTTVSVSCGSRVVVPQSATCTVTVTDASTAGTPSAPIGTVSFVSDATGASFGSSGACTLSSPDSGPKSACSLEYTPGQVGSGAHTITAAYVGDEVHAKSSGSGVLVVSAPTLPTAPVVTTTTPVPRPPVSPAPPKCRVTARERWRVVRGAKRRVRRRKVPVILVTYTCDQNAAVRIGGVVTLVPTRHGRKTTKARTINLALVSSSAVLGKAAPGVDVRLPASAAKAVRNGVRAAVAVAFRVFNANGIGVGTIRFPLLPPTGRPKSRR